jgi:hypothetical protein
MKNMAFCDKGPSKTSLFYIYLNWTAWFICWCLKGSVFFLYLALVFQIISSPLSSEIRLCLDCWSKKKKITLLKLSVTFKIKNIFMQSYYFGKMANEYHLALLMLIWSLVLSPLVMRCYARCAERNYLSFSSFSPLFFIC